MRIWTSLKALSNRWLVTLLAVAALVITARMFRFQVVTARLDTETPMVVTWDRWFHRSCVEILEPGLTTEDGGSSQRICF